MRKSNIIYKTFLLIIICISIILTTVGCSNDNTQKPWFFDQLHVKEAWKISKGSGEVIAFIDTGISSELIKKYSDRIVAPYNVLTNSQDIVDRYGHGTEMITAACGSGFKGIWGIASAARIMPIVAIGKDGHTNEYDLVKGIDWAILHGATVINLSLGSITSSSIVTDSINSAFEKHIFVVAAAGDYGDHGLLFPASLAGVISVEAQGEDGKTLSSSNYSDNASISIPGSNISVLNIDKDKSIIRSKVNGTSVATAITSGIVALALSENHSLTFQDFIDDMQKSLDRNHFLNVPYLLNFVKNGGEL